MGLLAKLFNDASDAEFKLAQDLVGIAMADGEISDAERKVITEICQSEGISDDTVQDCLMGLDRDTNCQIPGKRKEKAGCVYICGAVETPGIYEFCEGARLYELIEEAGGLDEEADADAVNLAMEVKDAQQIRIPYIGETLASDEEKLIDLNTASTADLCTIPGIGESRATAIIEYREKNGGFGDIEELKNISGIKDATFEKIKPYVCVR